MDTSKDYYEILGILPSAEDVVVVAAYRALAQRYHPVRWGGDPSVGELRIREVNEAYAVLRDPVSRKAYDEAYKAAPADGLDDSEDASFDDALGALEERWKVATGVFPDLDPIRAGLSRTAHRLAFAYVIHLLETKQFNRRIELAQVMEMEFLRRYFGTNRDILAYAKELIALGHRPAVRMLNNLVDVLGSDVDPSAIRWKVEGEFQLFQVRRVAAARERLREHPSNSDNLSCAATLIKAKGLELSSKSTGFFSPTQYQVFRPEGTLLFAGPADRLIPWVLENC